MLDPWTGKELTRVPFNRYTDGFVHDIMPFVYDLHTSLALGEGGAWVLAILAIVWTIDCFVGVIDVMDGVSFKQAQAMQKTNPEILQMTLQPAAANSIDPRND